MNESYLMKSCVRSDLMQLDGTHFKYHDNAFWTQDLYRLGKPGAEPETVQYSTDPGASRAIRRT